MASHLSPVIRTSAGLTKPRQLAPTVGLSPGGVEFSKGALPGFGSYVVGRMTKSRRGKVYIDDSGWGPDADSVEYGYRVPFGKIQVFIAKIGATVPEPDICFNIIEPAQHTQSDRHHAGRRHDVVRTSWRVGPLDEPAVEEAIVINSDSRLGVSPGTEVCGEHHDLPPQVQTQAMVSTVTQPPLTSEVLSISDEAHGDSGTEL